MGIGERMKSIRKGKYTQAELAEILGVHETTIRRWEAERDNGPKGKMLSKIASALNTTTAYLSGEIDDPTPSALEQVLNHAVVLAQEPPHITREEAMNVLTGNKPKASAALAASCSEKPNSSPELPESNVRPLSDVIWVPVVTSNIKVCCGDGAENDYEGLIWEEVGKYPILEADLIGYSWQLRDGGYHILTVEGDSMEPKVNDGDRILIADVEIRNGDLAVCLYRGRTVLRGVSFEKDGVRLIPWNKDYSEIFVPKDDGEDLRFVGKMIGKIQLQIQPLSSMI